MFTRRAAFTAIGATGAATMLAAAFPLHSAIAAGPRRLGDPAPVDEYAAANEAGRFKRPRHDSPLRDGKIARGDRDIVAAWFSDPTQRYRHFALGAEHEPASLVVSMKDRRTYKMVLPDDSVFEDREPRIVDIDGQDMVVAVRSYLKTGAALALIAVVPEKGLKIIAETPPIGRPFRWLNPAGIADFDGDGVLDIALVRTPHIEGELQLWTARNGALVQTQALDDVCNHALRSPHLKLHAIADFNGDGVADLAIPSQNRRSLRFLSFRGGRITEFSRFELPAVAAEDFSVVTRAGRPAVVVGFSAGRSMVVEP